MWEIRDCRFECHGVHLMNVWTLVVVSDAQVLLGTPRVPKEASANVKSVAPSCKERRLAKTGGIARLLVNCFPSLEFSPHVWGLNSIHVLKVQLDVNLIDFQGVEELVDFFLMVAGFIWDNNFVKWIKTIIFFFWFIEFKGLRRNGMGACSEKGRLHLLKGVFLGVNFFAGA